MKKQKSILEYIRCINCSNYGTYVPLEAHVQDDFPNFFLLMCVSCHSTVWVNLFDREAMVKRLNK